MAESLHSRAPRLIVPDVLRGVAIVAMLLAHAMPYLPDVPHPLRFVMSNVNDLASPLFALVMGMSAQLTWNAALRADRVFVQQALRGVVLIVLGIWVSTWGAWVAVVLAHLGLLLLVGVPLLRLRTAWVAAVAVATLVISDPLNAVARAQAGILTANPVVHFFADLTVLGHSYRLTNLLPFFLLGALLLRHGLRRSRRLWIIAGIVPVAYLARPVAERLTGLTFPSGSYLDTSHDTALVLAVYAIVVLLAGVSAPAAQRAVSRVFVPLSAWGRLALSLYLLHVGVIALWMAAFGWPSRNEPVGWILTVVAPLLVAWVWNRKLGLGPVEWVMGRITGRPKPFRAASLSSGVDARRAPG